MAMTYKIPGNGYMGAKPEKETYRYVVNGNRIDEIHNVKVHEFTLNDAEDPDLYAAQPMIEWQHTEQGTWVMEHAIEAPMWNRVIDPISYGYKYYITAKIQGPDYTYYTLRWGSK